MLSSAVVPRPREGRRVSGGGGVSNEEFGGVALASPEVVELSRRPIVRVNNANSNNNIKAVPSSFRQRSSSPPIALTPAASFGEARDTFRSVESEKLRVSGPRNNNNKATNNNNNNKQQQSVRMERGRERSFIGQPLDSQRGRRGAAVGGEEEREQQQQQQDDQAHSTHSKDALSLKKSPLAAVAKRYDAWSANKKKGNKETTTTSSSITPRSKNNNNNNTNPQSFHPEQRPYGKVASVHTLWPWQLKKSSLHFLGAHNYSDIDALILDSGHLKRNVIDSLQRHLLNSLRAWSNMSFALAAISSICFVLQNEIFYASVANYVDHCANYWEGDGGTAAIIFILQLGLTVSTLALVWARYQYYLARFRRQVIVGQIVAGVTFFQSTSGMVFLLDGFACLVHCPCGIVGCLVVTSPVSSSTQLEYNVHIISLVCLLRAALILPVIIHGNRFETQSARQFVKLHGLLNPRLIEFRDFLWRYPAFIIMSAYFLCIGYFAYFLLCFERPATYGRHFQSEEDFFLPSYPTCLWYCWEVQSTVGLGDWYPLTYGGRLVTVASNVVGMFSAALLISSVITKFKLNSEEQKLRYTLDWVAHRRSLPDRAASLIGLWYRSVVNPEWRPAYSNAVNRFRHIRQLLNRRHPTDDMAPTRELLLSVKSLEDSHREMKEDVHQLKDLMTKIALSLNAGDVTARKIPSLDIFRPTALENPSLLESSSVTQLLPLNDSLFEPKQERHQIQIQPQQMIHDGRDNVKIKRAYGDDDLVVVENDRNVEDEKKVKKEEEEDEEEGEYPVSAVGGGGGGGDKRISTGGSTSRRAYDERLPQNGGNNTARNEINRNRPDSYNNNNNRNSNSHVVPNALNRSSSGIRNNNNNRNSANNNINKSHSSLNLNNSRFNNNLRNSHNNDIDDSSSSSSSDALDADPLPPPPPTARGQRFQDRQYHSDTEQSKSVTTWMSDDESVSPRLFSSRLPNGGITRREWT